MYLPKVNQISKWQGWGCSLALRLVCVLTRQLFPIIPEAHA